MKRLSDTFKFLATRPGKMSFTKPFLIISLFLASFSYGQTVIDYPVYFQEKLNTIHEITILPIHFDCYYLTSGGIREYNHQMTVNSRATILKNVSDILLKKSFSVTTIPEDSYVAKCWQPLFQFYSAVNYEISSHVYGNSPFPNADKHFTYSLPPFPDSLVYPTTDAVLFIDGFDDRSTEKRRQRKGDAAAVSTISVVSMILGGPGVFVTVPEDQTVASCALVDRSGAIIWYYRYIKTGRNDMTTGTDVYNFFKKLFSSLNYRSEEK